MAGSARSDARARRLAGACSPLGLSGAIAGLAAIAFAEPLALEPPASLDVAIARAIALAFLTLGVGGATALLVGRAERSLAMLAVLTALIGALMLVAWPGAAGALLLFGLTPLLQGGAYMFARRTMLLGVSGALIGLSAIATTAVANSELSRASIGAALIWMVAVNAHALVASLQRVAPAAKQAPPPPATTPSSEPTPAPAAPPALRGPARHPLIDTVRQGALLAMVGFLGWVIGSFYPMPHATSGEAPLVAAETSNSKSAPGPAVIAPIPAPANPSAFENVLLICPQMRVSNQPAADAERRVLNYSPVVTVNGVAIASYPTRGACLSSGFGQRDAERHIGIDYHGALGSPILAAGDGVIRELTFRNDFGNMIVIDHGAGVYTRYAHMNAFAPGLAVGAHVRAGQEIGAMGSTGRAQAIHLHYEVLTGDYANPRGSFGLQPRNPLSPST